MQRQFFEDPILNGPEFAFLSTVQTSKEKSHSEQQRLEDISEKQKQEMCCSDRYSKNKQQHETFKKAFHLIVQQVKTLHNEVINLRRKIEEDKSNDDFKRDYEETNKKNFDRRGIEEKCSEKPNFQMRQDCQNTCRCKKCSNHSSFQMNWDCQNTCRCKKCSEFNISSSEVKFLLSKNNEKASDSLMKQEQISYKVPDSIEVQNYQDISKIKNSSLRNSQIPPSVKNILDKKKDKKPKSSDQSYQPSEKREQKKKLITKK